MRQRADRSVGKRRFIGDEFVPYRNRYNKREPPGSFTGQIPNDTRRDPTKFHLREKFAKIVAQTD